MVSSDAGGPADRLSALPQLSGTSPQKLRANYCGLRWAMYNFGEYVVTNLRRRVSKRQLATCATRAN